MKKIFFIFCILIPFFAGSQNWVWANSAGGINQDNGTSVCIDNSGNTYISGRIMLPVAYFNTDTLTINGFDDFFFAKYDVDGNKVWVKQFGGHNGTGNSEGPNWIICDNNSNSIYMTGNYLGTCNFGAYTLPAANNNDIFLAKFDLNGNCLWAKSAGGGGDDGCKGMAIDQNGNILISGGVEYGGTFDTINVTAGGILAKYNTNGNCLWAKHITTGGGLQSIKLFDSDIFMTAIIDDSIMSIDTMNIHTQISYYNKILARFDSVGHIKWAKLVGGPQNFGSFDFSMDNNGNCYVTDGFSGGYAIFDSDTIHSDTIDFYVAKYDQDGNFKWVRQSNATLGAGSGSIYSDIMGNTYIEGGFSGNANFGSYNVTSSTSEDLFIARYDSNGNCIGVRNFGVTGGGVITSDANANVYMAGQFIGSTNFGSTTLVSHGSTDILVAKLDAITGTGGLKTAMPNNQLIIYANPNTGKCNITIPDEFLHEKNLTLSIFDNSGKMIQQKTLLMNDGKIKLDLEAEAKGIYNVTLTNGKKMYSGKIVFE